MLLICILWKFTHQFVPQIPLFRTEYVTPFPLPLPVPSPGSKFMKAEAILKEINFDNPMRIRKSPYSTSSFLRGESISKLLAALSENEGKPCEVYNLDSKCPSQVNSCIMYNQQQPSPTPKSPLVPAGLLVLPSTACLSVSPSAVLPSSSHAPYPLGPFRALPVESICILSAPPLPASPQNNPSPSHVSCLHGFDPQLGERQHKLWLPPSMCLLHNQPK